MNVSIFRPALTAAAASSGAAVLILVGASAASAHVGISADTTAANSYALLAFGIPHGCGDSGTTRVAITLPAELNDAQPTVNPNWTVEKVTEQLTEPRKPADGTSITQRTSQIVYTAKSPLDHTLRDVLVLSAKLPDAAGSTLYFPTLQTCETGHTDWSETAADGEDQHSLKAPAPSVTITEAAGADGHGAAPAEHSAGSPAARQAPAAGSADVRSWAGLAAGVGGLALGGLALARSGRNRPQETAG